MLPVLAATEIRCWGCTGH